MLGRAILDHHPGVPGLKGTTLSQHNQPNTKSNALKPVPATALNATIPSWSQSKNSLKRTVSQANGNEFPHNIKEPVPRKKAAIDLTQGGGRVRKLHDTVFFDENDFEDDADIDLNEEISPSIKNEALPPQSPSTLVNDSTYEKSTTPQTPASSMPLPWSSSPSSHYHKPPPIKVSPRDAPIANMTKRRTLPWLDPARQEEERTRQREDERLAKIDSTCEQLTGGYSSQEKAGLEKVWERRRLKAANDVYEDLAETDPRQQKRLRPGDRDEDLEGKGMPDFVKGKLKYARDRREAPTTYTPLSNDNSDLDGKGIPEFIQEKIKKAKQHRTESSTYTPLPKDKGNSKFPWNTTVSAVKEQQKQLWQGNRKPTKDHEGDEVAKSNSRKKRESVAKVFLSDEQRSVLDLVSEKSKSVFFTGSAGTGKSALLREIIKVFRQKHKREPDRLAVTASTGLAACNVGGVTLHSFAGIGLGKEAAPELVKKIKKNQKAKQRWMRTKVLIIDEISMVDGDLFDKLESIARAIRNNGRPFGGIQLVITGDFFQLPPVPDYGRISKFCFDAATWNTSIEHTIGLTQVFRQKDPVFADMLNEMRLGKLTPKSIDAFRALNRPLSFGDDFEATELFPTRNEVDNANSARMRNLVGKGFEFRAEDGGSIMDHEQRSKLLANCMAPPTISLKKGAQVMLIKNIDDTLVNGSVGKVVAFMDEKTFDIYHEDEDEFQAVETMDLDDGKISESRRKLKQLINKDVVGDTSQKWPLVRFAIADGSSRDLLCQRESWKFELPNGEVQASRAQIPLILAWALSIHKAQGQTLDRVKVDLGKIFEKGQAYVALSRATCQEGLQISRFDPKKVMAHDRVRTFYDSLYSISQTTSSKVKVENTKKGMAATDYENDFIDSAFAADEDEDAMQAMYGR